MSHCYAKIKFTIILLIVFAGNCSAQFSRENKKLFFKADKAFEYGDFLTAMESYRKLYSIDSSVNELNFKLAVCMFELKQFRGGSERYFKKVPPADFPEVNYYLGHIYHTERKYDEAIACYTQYKFLGTEGEHSKIEIEDLISKCNTAMFLESKTDNTIKINNLGSAINTE